MAFSTASFSRFAMSFGLSLCLDGAPGPGGPAWAGVGVAGCSAVGMRAPDPAAGTCADASPAMRRRAAICRASPVTIDDLTALLSYWLRVTGTATQDLVVQTARDPL